MQGASDATPLVPLPGRGRGRRHPIVRPADQVELDAFLARYGGTVLRDGTPMVLPEAHDGAPPAPASSGWYLVRIAPQPADSAVFRAAVERAGAQGHHHFSSQRAVDLLAVVAAERALGASPNFVAGQQIISEHPNGQGGNLDAETWPYMTEDETR